MVVEGAFLSVDSLHCAGADTMVVESVPTASCPVHHDVDLVKPATQLKRVAARGQGGSCQTTHPHVRKVTHIVSLSPEALIAAPPVAGPSLTTAHPLFKEPALSVGDKVRPSGPVSSGKCNHCS